MTTIYHASLYPGWETRMQASSIYLCSIQPYLLVIIFWIISYLQFFLAWPNNQSLFQHSYAEQGCQFIFTKISHFPVSALAKQYSWLYCFQKKKLKKIFVPKINFTIILIVIVDNFLISSVRSSKSCTENDLKTPHKLRKS